MSTTPITSEALASQATGLLIQAAFVFWGHFVARAGDLGLAPTQAHALMVISPGQATSMRDLADSLECDPSTITGVADRLEAQGLLERGSQAGDRRVRTLTLTPAGTARRAQLMARLAEPPDSVRDLDARAVTELLEILGRILHAEASARAVAARCLPRRPA
ncbi:hypothetical protein BH23CHL8_BH23CHL8_16170 [soil metagenome]